MGAKEFQCYASGSTPREAFENALTNAIKEHGTSGGTGTIAEKGDILEVHVPEGVSFVQWRDWIVNGASWTYEGNVFDETPENLHDTLVKAIDAYNFKWGPAICIYNKEDENYLFMGSAHW